MTNDPVPLRDHWSDAEWYAAAETGPPAVVAGAIRHFEGRLSAARAKGGAGEPRLLFVLANLQVRLARCLGPGAAGDARLEQASIHARRALQSERASTDERAAAGVLCATSHLLLAERGADAADNLRRATVCAREAAGLGTVGTPPYVGACIAEGDAWAALAKAGGGDAAAGFTSAAAAFRRARRGRAADRALRVIALRREATALVEGMKAGAPPGATALRRAARLCRLAWAAAPDPAERGLALLNLAVVTLLSARSSRNPAEGLKQGVALAGDASRMFAARNHNAALALVTQAGGLSLLGELGEDAEAHFEAAVRLCRRARGRLRGKNDAESASVRLSTWINETASLLSLVEHDRGDAVAHLRRARSLCLLAERAAVAPFDRVQALLNGANARVLLAERGVAPERNARDAIARYHEARRLVPDAALAQGSSLANEANAHKILAHGAARRRAAKRHLLEAVRLYEAAFPSFPAGSTGSGWVLCNAADAYLRLARLPYYARRHVTAALVCLHRAADVGENAGDAALAAFAHRWAGEIYRRHGTAPGGLLSAYGEFRDALRATEAMRSGVSGEERRRRHQGEYRPAYVGCVETCLDLARLAERDAGGGTPPLPPSARGWVEEAWYWWEGLRQRTLLDLLGSARPRLDTPRKLQAWQRWMQAEERASAAATDAGPEDGGASASDRAKQLKRLLEALTEGHDLLPVPLPSGPDEWRRALTRLSRPHGAGEGQGTQAPGGGGKGLLVEFGPSDTEGYTIFLLPLWPASGGGELRAARVLSSLEQRAQAANALRDAVAAFSAAVATRDVERREAAFRECLPRFDALPALLGAAFVEPWADLLYELNPSELFFVPNAETQNLPLHAARLKSDPLVALLPVTYLPSASVAAELHARRAIAPPRHGGLPALVLGPPMTLGGEASPSLVAARDEAGQVAKAFGVEPFVGGEMRTGVLAHYAKAARWVHLCTHSRFSHEHYEASEISFSDRPLRVFEFFQDARFHFPHVDLWYQGSCESGQSRDDGSEEILGLARALLFAGARSLMATLWSVEDRSAACFASAFYRALAQGSSKAEAHRAACLDLYGRPEWANPAFSAPFVLYGDGAMGAPVGLRSPD